MAPMKDDQHNYSSEIGLAGEITQACLAIATRLVTETYSPHLTNGCPTRSGHSPYQSPSGQVHDASSEAEDQARPEASLSRKRSKLNTDRNNPDDGGPPGADTRNESFAEEGSDFVPGPRGEALRERPSNEVELFDTSRFGDIVGRLRLWADGLDVSEGRLDKTLERGTALKTALFTVLIAITTLLTKASREILHDEESAYNLLSLTEKASIISPAELHDDGESDHDEDGDQNNVLDFESLVEEFSDLSQDLLDLTPSLMDLEESRQLPEKGEESSSTTLQANFQPELPHDHFKRIIFDKYPHAQPALVETLAKECWNLYVSVKDGLIQRENVMKALAVEDKDSAYESMLQSELAPSLIGRLPAQATQEWDKGSETTSLAGDSVQLKDRPKTPRPPVDLGPNVDFVCNICSRLQKGISSTKAWRKHVFADIRPYICSFDDCRQSVARFATRSAWMQHEYTYHRQHLEWRCLYQSCPGGIATFLSEDDFRGHMVDHHHVSLTEVSEILLIAKTCRRVVASTPDVNIDCPVCFLSIPNKRSKIGRHLGRHMEDIALPIVSLVVPTDEDTNSSDGGGDETNSDTEKPPLDPFFAPYDSLLRGDPDSLPSPDVGELRPEKKAHTTFTDCTQAQAQAEAKAEKAAFNEQIVEKIEALLKEEKESRAVAAAKVAAATSAAVAAAAALPLPPEKEATIRFTDAIGRRYIFHYHLCNNWSGMKELIQQMFLHIDDIGSHVRDGHFDLLGPNGEIILPEMWDAVVEPDWTVTMHMWPMSEPEKAKTQPRSLDEYHGNFDNLRNLREKPESKDAKELTLPPILPVVDASNTTAYERAAASRIHCRQNTPIDTETATHGLGHLPPSEFEPNLPSLRYPKYSEPDSTPPLTNVPSQSGLPSIPKKNSAAARLQREHRLDSHANVHLPDLRHYCPYVDCPRSIPGNGFERRDELIQHDLTHPPANRYRCFDCLDAGHIFPSVSDLWSHIQIHHPDKDAEAALLISSTSSISAIHKETQEFFKEFG